MGVDGLIADLQKGLGMVRVNAAAELGKSGDKRAESALIDALHDENIAVRSNAAFALGELGSHAAVRNLLSLFHDPAERVRKSAVKALGMIAARDAVPALIAVIQTDGSRMVKKSAIRSLGQIGGERALRVVEPLVSHPDSMLADTARKAVELIKKREPNAETHEMRDQTS